MQSITRLMSPWLQKKMELDINWIYQIPELVKCWYVAASWSVHWVYQLGECKYNVWVPHVVVSGSQSSLKNSQNCSSIICSWISEYSCEEVPKLQQFLLMDLRILEIVPKPLQHFLLKHLRILGAVPKLQQGIYSSPKLLISVKQIRGYGVWLVARSKRQSM